MAILAHRGAAERELDDRADDLLRRCAAGLDSETLLRSPDDSVTVELFDEAAMEDAVKRARLLPHDAREMRMGYLKRASALGARRPLGMPLGQPAIEALRARFPNFGTPLDFVAANAALSGLSSAPASRLPSILLLGAGGVGKTALARALALALNLPLTELALGGISGGFVLAGLDVGYATGKPGRIFEALALGKYANPLIVLDELDKAVGDSNYPVTSVLYGLLEPLTARRFEDEAIALRVDASHIQWIATANYESAIEPALLSRFEVFEIPVPTAAQALQIALYIYADTIATEPWGSIFCPTVDESVLERFTDLPAREIRKTLLSAFGRAAIAGRRHLIPEDIRLRTQRNSLGFI